MHGGELFRLGRRLMKLGVHAIPPSEFRALPTGVRMVLVDVHENPGSTIGQIVERTGFPQSLVSASVARLRDSGTLVTASDPTDRRRTLVSPAPERLARLAAMTATLPTVDDTLRAALVEAHGPSGEVRLPDAIAALELLAAAFTPRPQPGLTAGSSPTPQVAPGAPEC